jgi:PadR family transcriptional regulator, regulatory protein AphA
MTVPDRELSPTSFIVLGLLSQAPGTPYDLKARVSFGLGNFWTVQHAQLYTETARLAKEGLLDEQRESEGRRRKTYSITKAGEKVLREWLGRPVEQLAELRDPGLLKVFFGADPAMIAEGQLEAHQAKLDKYEALEESFRDVEIPEGARLALRAGIVHEREFAKFWSSLL